MSERPKVTRAQELRTRRPPDRERVEAVKRSVELEIAVQALRESRGVTQEHVASHLGTSRPNVSRIEREDDLRVSTLQRYIEALGGELELVARFADGERYTLLGAVTARPRARRAAAEYS